MKVVITGGLGFIGSAVATDLLEAGHEVLLIDSVLSQVHGEVPHLSVPSGAEVARVDVRDMAQRYELLDGADTVCHFAAETGTAQSMHRMVHYVSVNDVGTAAVLEAMARCPRRPKQLILSSSRSVYGEGAYLDPDASGRLIHPAARSTTQLAAGDWEHRDPAGRPLQAVATPETLPLRPASVYAATKVAQEMLVMASTAAMGVRATILRFQNVYGEGQSLRNPYTGIISIFFNRARQGLSIPVYEDGLESRDFVHIDDVVRAIGLALAADLPPMSVMNIGSGVATSVHALATQLVREAGVRGAIEVTGQYRVGDIRHGFADQAEVRRLLGWSPSVSLEEGLRRFCSWARTQPVHVDRLDEATAELRKHGLTQAADAAVKAG